MYIPDNLTKADFIELASRFPYISDDGPFLLETFRYIIHKDGTDKKYPDIRLVQMGDRFFNDYIEVLSSIELEKGVCDIYCYKLRQIPNGYGYNVHMTQMLFDDVGNVVDSTSVFHQMVPEKYDDIDTRKTFYGRPQSAKKFKKGDIVEVMLNNKVVLGVVAEEIPGIDHMYGMYEKQVSVSDGTGEVFYPYDETDETMMIIFGPSYETHMHVSPMDVMKPMFDIPEKLRLKMEKWIEKADKEEKEKYAKNK